MKKANVIVNQGSFSSELIELKQADQITPLDLTGYTAKSQVRLSYDSTTPILTLTDGNGDIVFGVTEVDGVITYGSPDNGGILVKYDAALTSAIKFKGKELRGVRDIELTDPVGVTRRIVEGEFILTREVTHD